jgi:hypothetical protein
MASSATASFFGKGSKKAGNAFCGAFLQKPEKGTEPCLRESPRQRPQGRKRRTCKTPPAGAPLAKLEMHLSFLDYYYMPIKAKFCKNLLI